VPALASTAPDVVTVHVRSSSRRLGRAPLLFHSLLGLLLDCCNHSWWVRLSHCPCAHHLLHASPVQCTPCVPSQCIQTALDTTTHTTRTQSASLRVMGVFMRLCVPLQATIPGVVPSPCAPVAAVPHTLMDRNYTQVCCEGRGP
jgi:hypothetical protein